jgi:F0F1-type ATP synthase membrane subunit b/b'
MTESNAPGAEEDQLSKTEKDLARLRSIVVDARHVPMSASCMVNRVEVLSLIDGIVAGLPEDIERSRTVISEQFTAHAHAREQAAEIIENARHEAKEIASVSGVAREANEYAVATHAQADEEARQIRVEADMYGDSRLAEFEASLQKTSSQVVLMREQLAKRSKLDDSDVEALRVQADEEARQIRVEADMYVDGRLAEFEASLQKTSSQVVLMREQLAKRSKLDDSDVEALPSI